MKNSFIALLSIFLFMRDLPITAMRAINHCPLYNLKNMCIAAIMRHGPMDIQCLPDHLKESIKLYHALSTTESNFEQIESLIRQGAHPNTQGAEGYTVLHRMAVECRTKLLLESSETKEILEAKKKMKKNEITTFLTLGTNPNIKDLYGRTVLCLFIHDPEIVELLQKYGAQLIGNLEKSIELHKELTSSLSNFHYCKTLIQEGADPHVSSLYGKTLLHKVMALQRFAFIKSSLDQGVNPNIKDNQGKTIIHYPVKCSDVWIRELFHILFDYGINIYAIDNRGNTALYYVDELSLVTRLISCGLMVNHRNKKGQTALHDAALRGKAEKMDLFFKNGAFFNIKDAKNFTPLDDVQSSLDCYANMRYPLYPNMPIVIANEKDLQECKKLLIQWYNHDHNQ
jgi:ankyrin repeat protein